MSKKYEIDSLPKYLHISYNDNIKLKNIKQNKTYNPLGLYYAKGIEWLQFMKYEMGFNNINITKKYVEIKNNQYHRSISLNKKIKLPMMYLYKVIVRPNSRIKLSDKKDPTKILVLNSLKQVKSFTKKYMYKTEPFINWKRVSKDYGGIEFKNYRNIQDQIIKIARKVKEKGFNNLTWASAFDVNGGCIWNVENVRIEKLD